MNNQANQQWFSDGETMSFPRRTRSIFWLVNVILYCLMNMFQLKIQTGSWVSLWAPAPSGFLIDYLLAPLSVFNFPAHILVIALLTALICTVPILIALLYNLLHAVPFVLAVYLLGHNALLSLALFVSCAMVSFEPFRFKSKFVAVILALIPEIIYWIIFVGKNPESDALRWAVLFSPWALGFLISILIFGVVLTLGHFLRYRPGILMPLFGFLLAGAILLFNLAVGMNERDYQAEVIQFSPAQVRQFQNRSIAPLIERETAQRCREMPWVDPEAVRRRLRREWQLAFRTELPVGPGLSETNPLSLANAEVAEFYKARREAAEHIDNFILRHPQDRHVADALYFKGLLFDLKVDSRALLQEDMLKIYADLPSAGSEWIWKRLLERFPQSDHAITARVRMALLTATRKSGSSPQDNFGGAIELLTQAQQLCRARIEHRQNGKGNTGLWKKWLGGVFTPPPPTITADQLVQLEWQIGRWLGLLGPENHLGQTVYQERLANFIALDPRQTNYSDQLSALIKDSPFKSTGQTDPLIDNLELAQIELIPEIETQMAGFRELARRYPERDGGLEAGLLLAQLTLEQYNRADQKSVDGKQLLRQCLEELSLIVERRPDNYPGPQALILLQRLRNL